MAQITDNDNSDLLILSDDDSNMDPFNLDNNSELDISKQDNIISFDDNAETGSSFDDNVISLDDNTGLDLGTSDIELVKQSDDLDNTLSNESILGDNNDDLTSLSDISFQEIEKENTINEKNDDFSINDNSNVGTMTDILDRAMHEMTSRSEVIESEISNEESNISDLNKQIKDLESKVAVGEQKVADLNNEKNLITKNIKSLEKMKIVENNTSETKKKV